MSSPRLGTMDFTEYGRNQTLDWVTGQAPSPPVELWVQLHVGDPGSTGINNVAVESDRKQVTFGIADATGSASSTNDLDWLLVAASEIYTHASVWDSQIGGSAWYKGPLSAPVSVSVGTDFQIAAGQAIIRHT